MGPVPHPNAPKGATYTEGTELAPHDYFATVARAEREWLRALVVDIVPGVFPWPSLR
ncbi:hypothetical protein P3H15_39525 [Rhodococcus sp. T2V]|uniref:hypothetical protein n=1 Tax=Rhodococcus sp. T2V TaxID=3034164 RepID=UPI0023E2875C|nr:hypothetical protein [Rhodococcus sp. T2V]MDF3311092.1 hypothetical protein [Rhodococcus sp. T2V]